MADLDPNAPKVILVFWMHDFQTLPCVTVGRAAIVYGTMSDYGATSSTGVRLMAAAPPSGGFVEVQNAMFQDSVSRQGGRIWLELATGRFQDLDPDSQLVVQSEMKQLPGIELRDAGNRSNWEPILRDTIHRAEPLPGHTMQECLPTAGGNK